MPDLARYRNLTPGSKIAMVATKAGYPNIVDEQATTRQVYDTLPIDGSTNFQFFQNAQSRVYPFTNLNENKLQLGETLIVKRIYFSVITVAAGVVTDVLTFEDATIPEMYSSDFSVYFDTIQVVKDTSLTCQQSKFNKFASYANNEVIWLDSDIVLQPERQWRVQLRTPSVAAIVGSYIRCTLEGFGTIWSPKHQK